MRFRTRPSESNASGVSAFNFADKDTHSAAGAINGMLGLSSLNQPGL
jgi:hypothetical protein